jgi:hypothetical protein
MLKLTPEGEKIIAGLAQRYGIAFESAKMMLDAVARGGGSMAQFNLPEFGGSGQWMRGGMTMIGDMFNNSLKATVDNLCWELSNLLANQPGIVAPVMQSQSQSQGSGSGGEGVSLFVQQSPFQSGGWWPSGLGNPSATGAQNSVRYAYFPDSNRLAIDFGGRVEVFDTLDHRIQGFGQQQGGDASLTFSSQHGVVRVDNLPRVGGGGEAGPKQAAAPAQNSPGSAFSAHQDADRTRGDEAKGRLEPHITASQLAAPSGDASSILSLLEQLGQLREKGILTEEEFASKKAELLKRL